MPFSFYYSNHVVKGALKNSFDFGQRFLFKGAR